MEDDYAQYAQTRWDAASGIRERAAPNPRTLTGWFGASSHVLRVPLRAFLRFPVCPPSLRAPSSGYPSSAFSGLFPSAATQFWVLLRFPSGFPFPWAIFTLALPRDGSAGVGPGRQGPRSPVLPRPPRLESRDPPALQIGSGWVRWDAATESPVTSCPRAQDIAAPEPPRRIRSPWNRPRVAKAAKLVASSHAHL